MNTIIESIHTNHNEDSDINNFESTIDSDNYSDSEEDYSWIDSFEKTEQKYLSYYKTTPSVVSIFSLYVDKNKEVVFMNGQNVTLENGILKRDKMVSVIHSQKKNIFKIHDILQYNFTVDPDNIQDFIDSDISYGNCLIKQNVLRDIKFQDTISMLHNINALFLIFKESTADIIPTKSLRKTKRIHRNNSSQECMTVRDKTRKNLSKIKST